MVTSGRSLTAPDYGHLARIAYEEVMAVYAEPSCIGMTAALLATLRLLGKEDTFPLSVKVHVLNPALTRRLGVAKTMPSLAQVEKWGRKDGSFQVSVGYDLEQQGVRWPGHLVMIIPDAFSGDAAMLDLTITQADSPDHGIRLSPVLMGIRPEFITGQRPFSTEINRCKLLYRVYPEDRSYERTPVWQDRYSHDLMALRILARM